MKKIFYLFICLLLFVGGCYIFACCVISIENGQFCVFEDKSTGEMQVLRPGYNFIWQGVIPGRVSLSNISKKNIDFFDLRIKIKSMEELSDDSYSVKLRFNISYEIDEKIISDVFRSQISDDKKVFFKAIMKFLNGNFTEELSPYLYPKYRRRDILKDKDRIINYSLESVKKQCLGIGIKILSYEIVGSMDLPASEVYFEGVRYCTELREKEKNNKKELIKFYTKLQKEKNLNKIYFEKLEEISNLIKKNPDILRYIYIDKMADNVRVIIAPDKSGIPLWLDKPDKNEEKDFLKSTMEGDIDNLR